MLSGKEQPDSGSVELGETVQLASVDQFRDSMNDSNTVYGEISEGADIIRINNFEIPARAYVSRFNFKGSDHQKRIGELSGGERNRVHLAKLLKSGGNVLLLDEPTNDLDVETCVPWKKPCWNSRVAPWLSRTTVGSWTVSRHTSSTTVTRAR